MNIRKLLKPVIACIAAIFLVLVAASLFDILITVIGSRFYSKAAFIVIFGVAGVFAAILGYTYGIQQTVEKNETTRWTLLILILLTGLLFFFFLAKIEGGEYEPAFKAFGVTMAFSCLLFIKGRVE